MSFNGHGKNKGHMLMSNVTYTTRQSNTLRTLMVLKEDLEDSVILGMLDHHEIAIGSFPESCFFISDLI